MAKKASPQRSTGAPSGRGGLALAPVGFVLILLLILFLSMPTVVMLGFGLIPGIVAYLIDRTPQKNATYCVASLNFAGLFPSLMELWRGSHDVETAITILTDAFSLIVIYGSAAMGFAVYMAVPPVIAAFRAVVNEHRATQLKDIQRQLIEEWGEEVSTSAPEPASRQSRRRST